MNDLPTFVWKPCTAPLPGFFIGTHAGAEGRTLLTRDPLRYRTSFPKLKLIALL